MTLYDKGYNNYQKTLSFIQKEFNNNPVHPTMCTKCIQDCTQCGEPMASTRIYVIGVAINRLYYSLFQMLKSYMVTTPTEDISHAWKNNNEKILLLLLHSENEKRTMRLITSKMSNLRTLRNGSDYEKKTSFQHLERAQEYAATIMDNFQKLKSRTLGASRC